MMTQLRPWNREAEKIFSDVFGTHTIATISKMMDGRQFDKMLGEVATGKEANIFLVKKGKKFGVLKIYRVETADFNGMLPYIIGDHRFENVKHNRIGLIHAWARKEFSNLMRLHDAGVRVPKPMAFNKNILLMEAITLKGELAPSLKQVKLARPQAVYKKVVDYMVLAFAKAQLVHADLSEYNILISDKGPVIIDCGQAVLTSHPKAKEFLTRDIFNINKYFSKLGVVTEDLEAKFKWSS